MFIILLQFKVVSFPLLKFYLQVREFGKRKKRIASELYDKEKLSDSFLTVGDAYYNLRKFGKASKWYMKSWETYKSIGHLEVMWWSVICLFNVIYNEIA